jgi:hypothetical protein
MALRQIEYEGVTITAAAFEVAGTGRFLVRLSIARGSLDHAKDCRHFYLHATTLPNSLYGIGLPYADKGQSV